jgi:hypothetical protein
MIQHACLASWCSSESSPGFCKPRYSSAAGSAWARLLAAGTARDGPPRQRCDAAKHGHEHGLLLCGSRVGEDAGGKTRPARQLQRLGVGAPPRVRPLDYVCVVLRWTMARDPYRIAPQEHLGDALDDLAERGPPFVAMGIRQRAESRHLPRDLVRRFGASAGHSIS